MTRKEFLRKIFMDVFGSTKIKFKDTEGDVIRYSADNRLFTDCQYTGTYRDHMEDMFAPLLDSQYHQICIVKGKYSKPEPIEPYRQKALDFILKLKVFRDFNEEAISFIKQSIELYHIWDIYDIIIFRHLFNIRGLKSGPERGDDDFDEQLDCISKAVEKYLHEQLPKLKKSYFKKHFFREIAEKYPVIHELNLEEENKTVEKQLKSRSKNVIYTEFHVNYLGDVVDLVETYRSEVKEFAIYAYKSLMTEEDFVQLDMKLDTLLVQASGYRPNVPREDVIEFKDIAVNVYNRLYGRGHSTYEDTVLLAAWNAHEKLLDYLLMLSMALNAFDGK